MKNKVDMLNGPLWNKILLFAIPLAAIAGIIIAILVQPIISSVESLLNVPEDTIDMAVLYLRIYLSGAPFIFLYNFEAAVFRATGNTKTPLIVLSSAGVLNLVLNVFFVRHFGMDVDGVGIATTISNAFSALVLFYLLTKESGPIKVSFGQAAATFTGQNNGAGKQDRCKRTLYICLGFAEIFLFISAAILFTFSSPILGLFNPDPAVIEVGKVRLMWLFFAHIFGAVHEVMSGFLRGYGLAYIPAISSLICACGFRVFWVKAIFPIFNTVTAIYVVYPISLFLCGFSQYITYLIVKPGKKAYESAS